MENKWITSPLKYGISKVMEGEKGDPITGRWNYSTLGSPEFKNYTDFLPFLSSPAHHIPLASLHGKNMPDRHSLVYLYLKNLCLVEGSKNNLGNTKVNPVNSQLSLVLGFLGLWSM